MINLNARHVCPIVGAVLLLVFTGCGGRDITGLGPGESLIISTPPDYSEAQVLYLSGMRVSGRNDDDSDEPTSYEMTGSPVVGSGSQQVSSDRILLFTHSMKPPEEVERLLGQQPESNAKTGSGSGPLDVLRPQVWSERTFSAQSDAAYAERVNAQRDRLVLGKYFVLDGDPLSVIVSRVMTPAEYGPGRSTADIAIVLDLQTKQDEKVTPLVVWYQENVPPSTLLNLSNLLVYYNESWDEKMPPTFRLRMLDIRTRDNLALRSALQGVGRLTQSLGSLYPHPIIPGVELGIAAAEQVLTWTKSRVLMDYTVQFYSVPHSLQAGESDLTLLRKGSWIALGKPTRSDASFWWNRFVISLDNGRIYRASTAVDRIVTAEQAQWVSEAWSNLDFYDSQVRQELSQAQLETDTSSAEQLGKSGADRTADRRATRDKFADQIAQAMSRLDMALTTDAPVLAGARRAAQDIGEAADGLAELYEGNEELRKVLADFERAATESVGELGRLVALRERMTDPSRIVDAPYIMMTVSTAESAVPTAVLDRSAELTELLTEPENQDLDALEAKVESLTRTTSAYSRVRRLERERTRESLASVIEILRDWHDQGDKKLAMSPAPAGSLIMPAIKKITRPAFSGTKEVVEWWDAAGHAGAFAFDKEFGREMWDTPIRWTPESAGVATEVPLEPANPG